MDPQRTSIYSAQNPNELAQDCFSKMDAIRL